MHESLLSTIDTLSPVTVHPRNVTVQIGRNVTITCKANILGTLLYTWERRDDQIWTIVDKSNSTTYTTSAFGQHRCKVYNGTVSEAAVVIVHLQSILKITQHPKSVVIRKRGRFYTLKCNAIGPGTLVYSWERKSTHKWTTVSRHRRSYTTSSPGQYRCRVTNEAGSIVSEIATIQYCSKCVHKTSRVYVAVNAMTYCHL